jgi:hypothetical protein
MAEGGDYRAVEIKDEARAVVGQVDEILQQSIVNRMKLLPKMIWRMKKESTQRLRIGEGLQAG